MHIGLFKELKFPQDTVSSRLALTVWKDLVTERCASRGRASLVQNVQSNGKRGGRRVTLTLRSQSFSGLDNAGDQGLEVLQKTHSSEARSETKAERNVLRKLKKKKENLVDRPN